MLHLAIFVVFLSILQHLDRKFIYLWQMCFVLDATVKSKVQLEKKEWRHECHVLICVQIVNWQAVVWKRYSGKTILLFPPPAFIELDIMRYVQNQCIWRQEPLLKDCWTSYGRKQAIKWQNLVWCWVVTIVIKWNYITAGVQFYRYT